MPVVEEKNSSPALDNSGRGFPTWFWQSHLKRAIAIGLILGFLWGFVESLLIAFPNLSHPYLLGEMVNFIFVNSLISSIIGALGLVILAPFIYLYYRLFKHRIATIDPIAFYISAFLCAVSLFIMLWQIPKITPDDSIWRYFAFIMTFLISAAIAWSCYKFFAWVVKRHKGPVFILELFLVVLAILCFFTIRRFYISLSNKLPLVQGVLGVILAIFIVLGVLALCIVIFRKLLPRLSSNPVIRIVLFTGTTVLLASIFAELILPNTTVKKQNINIVLITLDSVNRNDLTPYNNKMDTTPNLARFAEQGITFERVQSVTSVTQPAIASMLTGKYPFMYGDWRSADTLSDITSYLPGILKQNGYRTAAFLSSQELESRRTLFSRGFDKYDDNFNILSIPDELADTLLFRMLNNWLHLDLIGTEKRSSEQTIDAALSWIKNNEQPFFLWVHLADAHPPYNSPLIDGLRYVDPDYYGRYSGTASESRLIAEQAIPINANDVDHLYRLYLGQILYQDKQLGRLLNVLTADPWSTNTMIVVCSDHGESFTKEYYMNHESRLWQQIIAVPMIMYLPDNDYAGKRIYDLVSTMDFYKTALSVACIADDEGQGVDLTCLFKEPEGTESRVIYSFCQTSFHPASIGSLRAVVSSDGYKLIWHPYFNTMELYNLNIDPGESHDLSATQTTMAKSLYDIIMKQFSLRPPDQSVKLKAFGY